MDTDDNTTTTTTTPLFKSPDELADVMPYYEESTAVDQAVHKALALIEQFASSSSLSEQQQTADNPWKNPQEIYQQLDQARNEITQAWEKLHAATKIEYDPLFDDDDDAYDDPVVAPGEDEGATSKPKIVSPPPPLDHNAKKEQEQFIRMAYMDMITDAFADVLEDLRQRPESEKEDPINVDTLVDCLQSGLDILTTSNYRLSSFSETDFEFGEENAAVGDDNKSDDGVKLTPHESRRRQLGYLLVDQL